MFAMPGRCASCSTDVVLLPPGESLRSGDVVLCAAAPGWRWLELAGRRHECGGMLSVTIAEQSAADAAAARARRARPRRRRSAA